MSNESIQSTTPGPMSPTTSSSESRTLNEGHVRLAPSASGEKLNHDHIEEKRSETVTEDVSESNVAVPGLPPLTCTLRHKGPHAFAYFFFVLFWYVFRSVCFRFHN